MGICGLVVCFLPFPSCLFPRTHRTIVTDETIGGVTNGNDLVAAYTRQSRHFPGPVAELGLKFVEVDERPQGYEE